MLCVMMALFCFSGCTKKDAEKSHKKETGKAKSGKLFTAADKIDNAQYDETSDLFGDSTVADLAFVEDSELEGDELDLDKDEDGFKVAATDLDDDMKFEDEWDEPLNVAGVDLDSDFDDEGDLEEISIDDIEEAPLQTAFDNEANDFSLDGLEVDKDLEEVQFKTVHFDINGKSVKGVEKDLLEENIALAAQAVEEGFDVVIEGHCCQLGPDGYNLALSQQRAESIKNEMVKRGIPAKNIKTVALGNEAPVVYTDAKEKSQQIKDLSPNRRVEISVS